jgi:signal peptidase II
VRRLTPWLVIASVILVLDQTTKLIVQASLAPDERVPVAPFFDLILVYNTGAAAPLAWLFGYLPGAAAWQRGFFIVVALGAILLIVHLLRRHAADRMFCAALALILGGAIGNLWDRIALGHVVDFVLLHAAGRYFPAFNIADSAITVGAAVLIWEALRGGRRRAGSA